MNNFKVFIGDTDVTQYVERDSIRITEQLNNRSNTCDFSTLEYNIDYSKLVYIYEGYLITDSVSNNNVIKVKESFKWFENIQPGEELIIDPHGSRQYVTIESIDHENLTVTLTENVTVSEWKFMGRLIFAGTVERNPDKNIGNSNKLEQSVVVSDRTALFNRKNIVDVYENMYIREILGRMVNKFCSVDSEIVLDNLDAAWTESGVARSMSSESSDSIEGTGSQSTGITGSGVALWTKTISQVDLTSTEHIRMRNKIKTSTAQAISSIKLRVGNDSSNYLERNLQWINNHDENCWNFSSHRIDRATETGSVNLDSIDRMQIEVVGTQAIDAGKILFDEITATTGGFTLDGSIRGTREFDVVSGNYEEPSSLIEELTKQQSIFRFIGYDRCLNVFDSQETRSPFNLDNSSENFSNLSIKADASMLRNRQVVRGGEAASLSLYTQKYVADGEQTSFQLDYKPKDLVIYVNDVVKTVGVENLSEEGDNAFVFNFNEKVVRNDSQPTLTAGDVIKFEYYPFQSIRVQVKNQASIDAMKALSGGDGIFDGPVINDTTIESFADARLRAKAEIDAYSNPIISATFDTEKGGLHAGQVINIVDSVRSLDEDFLIQKVTRTSVKGSFAKYRVECASTMFGLIEFFQLLLKKSSRINIDASELIDILLNQDETILVTDAIVTTQKPAAANMAGSMKKLFDFEKNFGSRTNDGIISFIENPVIVEDFESRQNAAWENDDDLKYWINTGLTYTHAISVNQNATTIHGVSFNANGWTDGRSGDQGGSSIYNSFSATPSLGSESGKLEEDFKYNINPRTVTIEGLTPGKEYVFVNFNGDWDGDGSGTLSITDQETGETFSHVRDHHFIDVFRYKATSTTRTFSYTVSSGTPHFYAFVNFEYDPLKRSHNKQRFAKFSDNAVGTIGFDESSKFADSNSLYMDMTSCDDGEYGKAILTNPLSIKASTEYDVLSWIESDQNSSVVGSYQFDGINDVILFDSSITFASNDHMTWCARVMPGFLGSSDSIFRDGGTQFRVRRINDDFDFVLNSFSTNDRVNVANIFELNTRIHICCTFDGITMKVYANNILVGSIVPTGSYDSFSVDRISVAAGDPWNGWMHDIRVYKYALNESQIADVYAGKEVGNPLIRYKGKPTGTTVFDHSVHGNNGTLHNGTTFSTAVLPPTNMFGFDLEAIESNEMLCLSNEDTFKMSGGDSILIDSTDELQVESFSIGAFVYLDEFTNSPYIVGKGVAFTDSTSNNVSFALYIQASGRITVYYERSDGADRLRQTNKYIDLKQWYHIGCSYNYTTGFFALYIDGVYHSNLNGGIHLPEKNDTKVSIGCAVRPNGTTISRQLVGSLKSVGLRNRALNGQERAKVYAGKKVGGSSMLIFLDGNVEDHSQYNHQPVEGGTIEREKDFTGPFVQRKSFIQSPLALLNPSKYDHGLDTSSADGTVTDASKEGKTVKIIDHAGRKVLHFKPVTAYHASVQIGSVSKIHFVEGQSFARQCRFRFLDYADGSSAGIFGSQYDSAAHLSGSNLYCGVRGSSYTATVGTPIALDTDYLLQLTCDARTGVYYAYLNGVDISGGGITLPTTINNTNNRIIGNNAIHGGNTGTNSEFYVWDCRVWDRFLSKEELDLEAASEFPVHRQSIGAFWDARFFEGSEGFPLKILDTYNFAKGKVMLARNKLIENLQSVEDFKRTAVQTFTSHADSTKLHILGNHHDTVGKTSISNITIEEKTTESVSDPGVVGFSEMI